MFSKKKKLSGFFFGGGEVKYKIFFFLQIYYIYLYIYIYIWICHNNKFMFFLRGPANPSDQNKDNHYKLNPVT